MQIWSSRVINSNGIIDQEFLSEEPTDSFIEELQDAFLQGRIKGFEIRMGYLNGGDSRIEFQHNG